MELKDIDKFGILEYLEEVVIANKLKLTKEEIIFGLLNGRKDIIRYELGTKGLDGIDTVFWLPIELRGNLPSKFKIRSPEKLNGYALLMYQMEHILKKGIIDFSIKRIEDLDWGDFYKFREIDKRVGPQKN